MKRTALVVLLLAGLMVQAQTTIEFGPVESNGTERFVDFKFMKNGHKEPVFGLKAENARLRERSNGDTIRLVIDSLFNISDRKCVSKNLSIVILADKGVSLDDGAYLTLREALVSFVDALPNYVKVYISMMSSNVSATERVYGGEGIRAYVRRDDVAEQSSEEKSIYASLISKIQEMNNVNQADCYYPDIMHNTELSGDTVTDKILFVLSGNVMKDADPTFFRDKILFNNPEYLEIPEELKAIYCIYFGDSLTDMMENEFKFICHRTPEGKFFPKYSVDSLKQMLLGAIDSIAMDYRMYYSVGEKAIYNGQPLALHLKVNKPQSEGVLHYSFGTTLQPVALSPNAGEGMKKTNILLWGALFGIALIIVAYLVMQFLVPYVQYEIFKKKYVKKYKQSVADKIGKKVVLQQCYYCKDNFEEGDTVVTKCKHTVHWECWEENRDRCPEYGINSCKEGLYYYNRKKLADERNSPYFTSWLIYGLVGGLVAWLLFRIIPYDKLFPKLIATIVGWFYGAGTDKVLTMYLNKIQPLLLCGIVLGFSTTFLFSYLIEFRKKTWKNMLLILARSIGNSIIGCLAFLLGSIVFVALGKSGNCLWIDWVPWLFFGCGITWLMSYKTDIDFKEALIGGLISVVLSFVAIYLIRMEVIGMFGFMVYAAGLGASIALVHFSSENYFLHIEGPTKERDIAIYKWMNVAGGSNHVTIGRSRDCVIEMNWDPSDQIQDKQVELYIENDHPYCLALTEGTTIGDENRVLKQGDSILLDHGASFTIGNTKFTYVEKDK
ncbi:MAG: hypothetical protein ACTTKO_08455 [Candidatus Limimorpha sp.]